MSELYADAFHEEKVQVVFGKDIYDERSDFHAKDFQGGFPSSMCQDVSFVKSEDKLDYYCRNILAVSNNIICYSVTQKRNLMRLIDTQSGEKGILRGHEAGITDLSISPKDENLLCSVDYSDCSSSDPKNGSHFFVWQKAYGSEKNIDFNMLAKSSISGYILAAHPLQSNIWAISNGEKLAVVSTGKLAGAYESYSMHVVMEGGERITNAVFSNDGRHLIISINKAHSNISYLQIYAIQSDSSSSSSPLIQGDKETLKPLYTEYHTFLNLEDFISFMVFDQYIFTVSHVNEYSFASFDDEHDDSNAGDGSSGEGISSSSKSNGMVHYQMNVYKFKDNASDSTTGSAGVYLSRPELVQSVTLHLPEFKTPKLATTSSNGIATPQNPFLECSIELEMKKGEFVVVSSRKSRYVAVLAINTAPKTGALSPTNLVFYHITLIDLMAPVLAMRISTVLGQDHHSAEQGEHLEISCYQEYKSDKGASVQQYFILVNTLYDFSKYTPRPSLTARGALGGLTSSAASATPSAGASGKVKDKTIMALLSSVGGGNSSGENSGASSPVVMPKSLISPSSASSVSIANSNPLIAAMNTANPNPPALTLNTAPTTNTGGINILASMGLKPSTAPATVSSVTDFAKILSLSSNSAPAAAPAAPAGLDFSPMTLVADKEELTKLSNLSSASSSTTDAPASNSSSGMKKLDSSALFAGSKAAAPTTPAPTEPVSSAAGANILAHLKGATPAAPQNATLLNLIGGGSPAANAAPASTSVLASILNVNKPSTATSTPVVAPAPVAVVAPATFNFAQKVDVVKPFSFSASKKEVTDASSTPAKAETTVAASAVNPVSVPVTPISSSIKLHNFFGTSSNNSSDNSNNSNSDMILALQAVLTEMKEEITFLSKSYHNHNGMNQRARSDTNSSQPDNNNSASTTAGPASVGTATAGSAVPAGIVTEEYLTTIKDEILKEIKIANNKQALHTIQTVKNHIDNENKKLADSYNRMKMEVTAQVADQIQSKVLPQITQKLKESLKDSLKETFKANLGESFRNAFENSLLPAFQTGVDRLFAQLNNSFENGLKKLMIENETIQQMNTKSYEDLESEVHVLNERVQSLEAVIMELNNRLSSVGNNLSANTTASQQEAEEEAVKNLSPMELLQQGQIEEAVHTALDMKDITETLTILSELTPSIVNNKCSNIIRLCIVQQLAADMSMNIPSEGIGKRIDWIKNLVLPLVRIPANVVTNDKLLSKHFKTMIAAVYESILVGKDLILSSQYDNGEDDAIEVPLSAEADLTMLEMIIQSKL